MPQRAKPPGVQRFVSTHAKEETRRGTRRGNQRPTKAMTAHWRRFARPVLVRKLVSATESLRWSPALISVLLEELYMDGDIEKLLGTTPRKLPFRKYPQAVAMALILRHSWRADDLAAILERLGLSDTAPS